MYPLKFRMHFEDGDVAIECSFFLIFSRENKGYSGSRLVKILGKIGVQLVESIDRKPYNGS